MSSLYLHLSNALGSALPSQTCDAVRLAEMLGAPPDPRWGDIALGCFPLARSSGISPAELAAQLASQLVGDPLVNVAEARGPYLNIFLKRPEATRLILQEVLAQGEAYGRQDVGGGRTIVLDYSSPNIAKPFHFGHLRSTNLGACLARIWEALGYRVWRQNYLGDWGTQFGLVMYAWRMYGDEKHLSTRAVEYLVDLYIRANREAEEDPSVRETARLLFKRLEDGDPELKALWARFRELSIASLQRTYARLSYTFDSYEGEAAMNDKVAPVIDRFLRAGVATVSDGAVIVEVADLLGRALAPCMLRKSDGATTYAARDCAAAIDRWERHRFAANVYVVARQQDHFAQVFTALRKLGLAEGWTEMWPDRCENVPFGFVRGMSTRNGTAVWLDEVLDEARSRADMVRAQTDVNMSNTLAPLGAKELDEINEAIGQAAVLHFDVSARRMSDLTFAWDDVLRFEGHTGPYLQYTHARICGIYRKLSEVGAVSEKVRKTTTAARHITSDDEWRVVRKLADYPRTVLVAGERREPSEVAHYLFELASHVNRFYYACRVLDQSDPTLTSERLQLVEAARTVLSAGLRLLGIKPLEAM